MKQLFIKNNYNIMLICHKRVASNEATILQACHMSDVYATLAVPIMRHYHEAEVVCL